MRVEYPGQIEDSKILIIPSENLYNYINGLPVDYFKTKNLPINGNKLTLSDEKTTNVMFAKDNADSRFVLNIEILKQIFEYIQQQNEYCDRKLYFHELLEGSVLVLPKNTMTPRNEELDRRCKRLKAKFENQEYHSITNSMNTYRKVISNNSGDDSIYFQIRMMNRHLIAVFQYVISISTGFIFGFYGIELLTAPLDLGFRLLLGVMFGLTVAIAELYFLAEALTYDESPNHNQKSFKVS